MKTAKGIARYLCRREVGKKQVNIAQMTEIVGRLSELIARESVKYRDHDTLATLRKLGRKRLAKGN